MKTERIDLNRQVVQGNNPRHERVGQALKGVDANAARSSLENLTQALLTGKNNVPRSGYLRLLNSSHADQSLQIEKRGWWSMAFNPNRNRETAQALLTLAENAGVQHQDLTNYLKAKVASGEKIKIKTLQGHLRLALASAPHGSSRSSLTNASLLKSAQQKRPDSALIGRQSSVGVPQSPPPSVKLLDDQDAVFKPQNAQPSPEDAAVEKPLHVGAPLQQMPVIGAPDDQQEAPKAPVDKPPKAPVEEPPQMRPSAAQQRRESEVSMDGGEVPVEAQVKVEVEVEVQADPEPIDRRGADKPIVAEQVELRPDEMVQAHHESGPLSEPAPRARANSLPSPITMKLEPADQEGLEDAGPLRGARPSVVQAGSMHEVQDASELSQVDEARLEALSAFTEFISGGLDNLKSIRAMLDGVAGDKPRKILPQTYVAVSQVRDNLLDLRDIEERYDDSPALKQELKAALARLSPAMFYFNATLPELQEQLGMLRVDAEAFASELAADEEIGTACAELENGLMALQDDFAALLEEGSFRAPSSAEIESRQNAWIREHTQTLDAKLRELNPQCESFKFTTVITPLSQAVDKLIAWSREHAALNAKDAGVPQAKRDLEAQELDILQRLKSARSLLDSIQAADEDRRARLALVKERFPNSPEAVKKATATLRHPRVDNWFTENDQRVKHAIRALEGMADKLLEGRLQFDELREAARHRHPLDERLRELEASARSIEKMPAGAGAEVAVSTLMDELHALLRGDPKLGAPTADQRKRLQQMLVERGPQIERKLFDSLDLALEDMLRPLKEQLDQAVKIFDQAALAWDSKNVELEERLQKSQAQQDAAQAALDARAADLNAMGPQINALHELEELEQQWASLQDGDEGNAQRLRERRDMLLALLPDSIQARLGDENIVDLREEIENARDNLSRFELDSTFYLSLKKDIQDLRAQAEVVKQLSELAQEAVNGGETDTELAEALMAQLDEDWSAGLGDGVGEEDLINEIEERANAKARELESIPIPLTLAVEEARSQVRQAQAQALAHQVDKPILAAEVQALRSDIRKQTDRIDRVKADFEEQLFGLREALAKV